VRGGEEEKGGGTLLPLVQRKKKGGGKKPPLLPFTLISGRGERKSQRRSKGKQGEKKRTAVFLPHSHPGKEEKGGGRKGGFVQIIPLH